MVAIMSTLYPAVTYALAGLVLAIVENVVLGIYLKAKRSTNSTRASSWGLIIKARTALFLFPVLGYLIGSKVVN
jgi:hypothetical protein